jgi:hypothetical protein
MDFHLPEAHHHCGAQNREVTFMGDKSPKAKDKSKKQHDADKSQKHEAAVAKAKPPAQGSSKNGK